MKKKDIALIKIIQFVGRKKSASISEIQDIFDIESNGSGKYKKKDKKSISKRSLGRYIDELCSMEIIRCEGRGSKAQYSINEEKYTYDYKCDSQIINSIITAVIERNDMNLLKKFADIVDDKYSEDKIFKMSDRIRTINEPLQCSEDTENVIINAICSGKAVNLQYKKRDYEIFPAAIVKSGVTEQKYLFYVKKGRLEPPFELGMIKNAEMLNETYTIPEKILNNIKSRWDIDGGNKIHVEVLFLDKGKLIKEIKDKLQVCGRIGNLKETEEGYIYKDDIIGLSNFKAWLREYNSIAVVKEPLSLAEEICRRNNEKLLRYEGD